MFEVGERVIYNPVNWVNGQPAPYKDNAGEVAIISKIISGIYVLLFEENNSIAYAVEKELKKLNI